MQELHTCKPATDKLVDGKYVCTVCGCSRGKPGPALLRKLFKR